MFVPFLDTRFTRPPCCATPALPAIIRPSSPETMKDSCVIRNILKRGRRSGARIRPEFGCGELRIRRAEATIFANSTPRPAVRTPPCGERPNGRTGHKRGRPLKFDGMDAPVPPPFFQGALPGSSETRGAEGEPGKAPLQNLGTSSPVNGEGQPGNLTPPAPAWGGSVPRPLADPRGEFAPLRHRVRQARPVARDGRQLKCLPTLTGGHHACGGGALGERSFAHGGKGWRRTAGLPAAAPHGPVVETERGFAVLNPRQLDRSASRQPAPGTATPERCLADRPPLLQATRPGRKWLGREPPRTAERLANRMRPWRSQFLKLNASAEAACFALESEMRR